VTGCRYQKEQAQAELADVMEHMAKEEDVKGQLQDQVGGGGSMG
jgi:hypothetical protein